MDQLLPWVDESKISHSNLCSNTSDNAITALSNIYFNRERDYTEISFTKISCNENCLSVIEKLINIEGINSPNIHWNNLCKHPNFIHYLEYIIDTEGLDSNKLYWPNICANSSAFHLISRIIKEEGLNSNKIYWPFIWGNSSAFPLITKIINEEGLTSKKIYFPLLCDNKSVDVLEMLEDAKFYDFLDWNIICENENATNLLKKYHRKIRLNHLCLNSSDYAVSLICKKVQLLNLRCFHNLCSNTNINVIPILENLIENEGIDTNKINWKNLSVNKTMIILIETLISKYSIEVISRKLDWGMLSINEGIFYGCGYVLK